jgi:hypothetical protein
MAVDLEAFHGVDVCRVQIRMNVLRKLFNIGGAQMLFMPLLQVMLRM